MRVETSAILCGGVAQERNCQKKAVYLTSPIPCALPPFAARDRFRYNLRNSGWKRVQLSFNLPNSKSLTYGSSLQRLTFNLRHFFGQKARIDQRAKAVISYIQQMNLRFTRLPHPCRN